MFGHFVTNIRPTAIQFAFQICSSQICIVIDGFEFHPENKELQTLHSTKTHLFTLAFKRWSSKPKRGLDKSSIIATSCLTRTILVPKGNKTLTTMLMSIMMTTIMEPLAAAAEVDEAAAAVVVLAVAVLANSKESGFGASKLWVQ